MPGIPILIGGCEDKTTVRALIEAGRWLTHTGSPHLQESMKLLASEIVANGKGGDWETEKFRHNMPLNLTDFLEQRSWVSGGWTIPRGVQPFTPEVESKIVQTIVRELNCLFDLDLGKEPICDRLIESEKKDKRILVIGGSHAIREGEALASRGYDVTMCAVAGWRPNMSAIENMREKVAEAVSSLEDGDPVLIHCFDNIAFMARSEEGGDLPIRRYPDGRYHIEGELVLASKERLFMYFKNSLPIFKLLERFRIFFLSPMPRYLYVSCCTREDHAPNRELEGFEADLRASLALCRGHYKDFFYTSGFRNVTVLNPGLELPQEDAEGFQLWGPDPVHPLSDGYAKVADLICREVVAGRDRSKKRPGDKLESRSKRQKYEPARPSWIGQQTPIATVKTTFPPWRGQGGGPNNWRGQGGGRGRGFRPWRRPGGRGRGYD
jgi:hypothetical protein